MLIRAWNDSYESYAKWKNGIFLIKFPKEIIDINIKDISIDDKSVKVLSYEKYENEGCIFVKILTENDVEKNYNITMSYDITANPTIPTQQQTIEVYAINDMPTTYDTYFSEEDLYDINDDGDTSEIIAKNEMNINLISPNTLITSQSASNYNGTDSVVTAPKLVPIEKDQSTATINIEIFNNYAGAVSEVVIIGKIPFIDNTYAINGAKLGSNYTTTMSSPGISIPKELEGIAKIYYSEKDTVTKELKDMANEWKDSDVNFERVKSFMIILENHELQNGDNHKFSYEINIPDNLEYDQVSYSHHAIYFSLNTKEGKYRTQTEPSKLGFIVQKTYNLELTKYQKGIDKVVPDAIYAVIDGVTNEQKIKKTNKQGKLNILDLCVGRKYTVKEIKTPIQYELNKNEISFKVEDENKELVLKDEQGENKDINIVKDENENYTVQLNVEDEVKAKLKIVKRGENSYTKLKGVKFKVTGEGIANSGKIITTNSNGEAILEGLYINKEYVLYETDGAEGYYVSNERVRLKISNVGNSYIGEILSGKVESSYTGLENNMPLFTIELKNEKYPVYNLTVKKVEKGNENNLLSGAKFRLIKAGKEIGKYETGKIAGTEQSGQAGMFTISGLYAYEKNKDVDQTYILQETQVPEGFSKIKDIEFKVTKDSENVYSFSNTQGLVENVSVSGNNITITIADNPSFKLIKQEGETGDEPGKLLPDTKFVIYNIDEGSTFAKNSKGETLGKQETIDGQEYYVLTTDSQGQITADLPQGIYKAVEVKASDDKYTLAEETYFGIGMSQEVPKMLKKIYASENAKEKNQTGINVIEGTSDGGYIIGGALYNDVYLRKYNADDTIIWDKKGKIVVNSLVETSDNGFLVGGYFKEKNLDLGKNIDGENITLTSNGVEDGIIIKYNGEGQLEWAKSVGGSANDQITSVIEVSEGEYIVAGYFRYTMVLDSDHKLTVCDYDESWGYSECFLVKYKEVNSDEKTQIEWAKSLDSSETINTDVGDDYIVIAKTENQGCIVGITSYWRYNDEGGAETVYGDVLKYDKDGNKEWAKDFEGPINSIAVTKNGEYIIGGYEFRESYDYVQRELIDEAIIKKYNSKGDLQWSKVLHGYLNGLDNYGYTYDDLKKFDIDNQITAIETTSDGGYLVSGYFESLYIVIDGIKVANSGANAYVYKEETYDWEPIQYAYFKGRPEVILAKYNEKDELEYVTTVEGYGEERIIRSISETENNEYLIAGFLNNNNSNNNYNQVIKYKEVDSSKGSIKINNDLQKISADILYSTYDGGYIAGTQNKILKYNSNDELEWEQQFSGTIKSLKETKDKGFIIASDNRFVKYDKNGNMELEKFVEGTIESIIDTSDRGYILAGSFTSSSILEGNNELINQGSEDGMIIKYDKNADVEWARRIGENGSDYMQCVQELKEGKYLVGGYSYSSEITLDKDHILKVDDHGIIIKYDENGNVMNAINIEEIPTAFIALKDGGFVATSGNSIFKYNADFNLQWLKNINASVNSITETSDGNYLVGASFSSDLIRIEDYVIMNSGEKTWSPNEYEPFIPAGEDGLLLKYGVNGELRGVATVDSGYDVWIDDGITSVIETKTGRYLVSTAGEVKQVIIDEGVQEQQEVIVKNEIKTFNITTEVEGEIGGEIKVQDKGASEVVKYNETSNPIIITPRDGYEIVKVTINGQRFTQLEDLQNGSYKIPAFTEVKEDKHVIVSFTRTSTKFVINKRDSDGTTPLAGAKFRIEEISDESKVIPPEAFEDIVDNGQEYVEKDESKKIDQALGSMENNGQEYIVVDEEKNINNLKGKIQSNGEEYIIGNDKNEEIDGLLGNIVNNGPKNGEIDKTKTIENVIGELGKESGEDAEYSFIKNDDGTYESTNGKNHQGGDGVDGSTSHSYIPINLNSYKGNAAIVISAEVSSEDNYDYGYAVITKSTAMPSSSSSGTVVINEISGEESSDNYTAYLQGEDTYYLHLVYYKDDSSTQGDDRLLIKSINVYEVTETTSYYFEEKGEGIYVSNNIGQENTIASSYVPINLTNVKGKITVVVNAEISSSGYSYGRGYAVITTDTAMPTSYNTGTRVITEIYGQKENTEYKASIEGGKQYYLHFVYNKQSNYSGSQEGITDTFKINSIKTYKPEAESYYFEGEGEGPYVSNNVEKPNTTANSYIPINLTNKQGKIAVVVNAQVSGSNYGYATVTTTPDRVAYNDNISTRFIYISGNQPAKDYTIYLDGGYKYYLHLGYYKNYYTFISGTDTFTVNSVNVYETKKVTYGFQTEGNKYVSSNVGQDDTICNSYMPINLDEYVGKKVAIVVNAEISCEMSSYSDYGYVTITNSINRPSSSSSGTSVISRIYGEQKATDYTTIIDVKENQQYYLHFVYYKNSSKNEGNDIFTINSVNIYETKNVGYNFKTVETQDTEEVVSKKYVSTNQGKANTEASAYIPINLTGFKGNYNVIVNAQISSQSDYDYGYVAMTTNTSKPSSGFMKISGTASKVSVAKDYTTTISGDRQYYLHLVYHKDTDTDEGTDTFIINSIKIVPTAGFSKEVVTDDLGQAIVNLDVGTYSITEIEAPDGYELAQNAEIYTMKAEGDNEITITNNKRPQLIVHHYEKGTGINDVPAVSVAEDEIYMGTTGETYETKPKMNLEKYELAKNEETGAYDIPDKANGTYEEGVKEIVVTYYYTKKKIPLIVHHYIEGTTIPVTLANGEQAMDETIEGTMEGETYTAQALKPSNDETADASKKLAEKYELVGEASRQVEFKYPYVEIVYEYRIKTHEIRTRVQQHMSTNEIGEELLVDGGTISGQNKTPYERVQHGETNKNEIVITPEQNYQVGSITINEREIGEEEYTEENGIITLKPIENIVQDQDIVVTFEKLEAKVIVHHYIYKKASNKYTNNKVPLDDGTFANDDIIDGALGDIYLSKEKTNLQDGYELYKIPENKDGIMTQRVEDIYYYYASQDAEVEQTVTKDGTQEITENDQEVEYNISYTANIRNYAGEAEITITDLLPYELDIDKMKAIYDSKNEGPSEDWLQEVLDGGLYEEKANDEGDLIHTITWTVRITDIDAKQIDSEYIVPEITKHIKVIFKGINSTEKSFVNSVTGKIFFVETEQTEQTEKVTYETKVNNTVSVKVTKKWNYGNNIENRPKQLILQVKNMKTDAVVASYTVSEQDNWTHIFTGLPKYDEDGSEIEYTVGEQPVEGEEELFNYYVQEQ